MVEYSCILFPQRGPIIRCSRCCALWVLLHLLSLPSLTTSTARQDYFDREPHRSNTPKGLGLAPDEDADKRRESAALLVQIYQQVHDPDALFGMLKEGTTCFEGSAPR